MKRLLPLFCILVILFASAGVASADKSLPGQFLYHRLHDQSHPCDYPPF